MRYVTARYGGMQSSLNTYGTINAVNVPVGGLRIENSHITQGYLHGLEVISSDVTISRTAFTYNGNDPRNAAALYATGSNSVVNLIGNRFQNNKVASMWLLGNANATLINNVVMDGQSSPYAYDGIYVDSGARAKMLHTTIARNPNYGMHIGNSGTVILTNTIFAQNGWSGAHVEAGGALTLTNTLWDQDDLSGSASETGHVDGPANFAPDGYHLTRYSMAMERGLLTSVTDDIDGDTRPLPIGTAPDLGADEYPYTFGQDFAAEKAALNPKWAILPDPINGNPSGYLRQGYFIRYFYGSPDPNPPGLTVTVTDTLPAELAFENQSTIPALNFTQQGQTLTWQSQQPLQKNQSGEIVLSGLYDQPVPGRVLTNTAQLRAGAQQFDLQASTQVPLFPPLITYPGNGEICTDPSGTLTLTVEGAAQNSAIVKLYENNSYIGQTTATASGLFSFTYTSTQVGVVTTTLSARTCAPPDPNQCSNPYTVQVTPQRSFWDPQRSFWNIAPQGWGSGSHFTYRFRDWQGLFSTQNLRTPKGPGLSDATLRLYICFPVDNVWAIVDGVPYSPTLPLATQAPIAGQTRSVSTAPTRPNWWVGETIINVHQAVFHDCSWLNATRNLEHWENSSCWLTDPDGFVFDVTKGLSRTFDLTGTLTGVTHTISGVTVTAYVSMPQWGGWVPWPAQLYNNQVNPQVTGNDGYFAFFTPPGFYYLQVDKANGYQAWRSPVVQVITEIVHVNVPLSPWSNRDISQVTLTPNGPAPIVITIPAGSAVEWISQLSGSVTPADLMSLIENPILHPLSALSPLSNTLGWDGGMMVPGQIYRRQFRVPGTYTYSDSNGHTGTVVVTSYRVYLPITLKK